MTLHFALLITKIRGPPPTLSCLAPVFLGPGSPNAAKNSPQAHGPALRPVKPRIRDAAPDSTDGNAAVQRRNGLLTKGPSFSS